jgi:hypothetical protein
MSNILIIECNYKVYHLIRLYSVLASLTSRIIIWIAFRLNCYSKFKRRRKEENLVEDYNDASDYGEGMGRGWG